MLALALLHTQVLHTHVFAVALLHTKVFLQVFKKHSMMNMCTYSKYNLTGSDSNTWNDV